MTEPKAQHPMFEPGDKFAVEFTFIDEINDGRVRASLEGVVGGFLFPRDTAFRPTERAPRPLVPGPAVYRQCLLCTIKYISEGEAWIVFSGNGESLIVSAHDLRNTEGAPS